jgi:hypothetical protein
MIADLFDGPLGTPIQRARSQVYPSPWVVVNGFDHHYALAGKPSIHTGDDLARTDNWTPHQPIYAVGNGVVTCAHRIWLSDGRPSTWGNLIVIQHTLPDNTIVFSRYGHSENLQVREGDVVTRGQHISDVGNGFGLVPYHLHFDISPGLTLLKDPANWPWLNDSQVRQIYVDPGKWIGNHRGRTMGTPQENFRTILNMPGDTPVAFTTQLSPFTPMLETMLTVDEIKSIASEPAWKADPTIAVSNVDGLHVRSAPSTSGEIKGSIERQGTPVQTVGDRTKSWVQVAHVSTDNGPQDGYVFTQYLTFPPSAS